MAEELKKAISLDELSHFKAKQDLFNAGKFQPKGSTDLTGAVRYDAVQVLTEEQKAQARANIGAAAPGEGGSGGGTVEGAVRYDMKQTLADDDKARARENIGASDFDGEFIRLKNIPFGYVKSKSIKWDGNTEGKLTVPVTMAELGLSGLFCKVAEINNGGSSWAFFNNFGVSVEHFETTNSIKEVIDNRLVGELRYWNTYLAVADTWVDIPVIAYVNEPCTIQGTQFPESGIYFMWVDGSALGMEGVGYVQESYGISEKRKLPVDLIPDRCVMVDNSTGLIPANKLPSYVDDVVEGYLSEGVFYENAELEIAITGESGKIYVDLYTGNTYRWSGTTFVRLNPDEYTFATTSDIDDLFQSKE